MSVDINKISVTAFLQGLNKGESARRCLFGRIDDKEREENQRFLRKQLYMRDREVCKKWNFDFTTETPLPGKFQWEKVTENENRIPMAYALPQFESKPIDSGVTTSRIFKPLALSSKINLDITDIDTLLQKSSFTSTCNTSVNAEKPAVKLSTDVIHTPSIQNSSPSFYNTNIRPVKRKLNQTRIPEYFAVKKCRHLAPK